MDDIYKLAKKFQSDLLKGDKAAAIKIGAVFASIDKKVAEEIKKVEALPWNQDTAAQYLKLTAIRKSLIEELAKVKHLASILGPQVNQTAKTWATEHVQAAAKTQLGPKYAAAIDVKAAGGSAGVNAATATSFLYGGPLQELFSAVSGAAIEEVKAAFGYAMAAGSGPGPLARAIRNAGDVSKHRAATIARTETLRVYRETTRKIYQDNADLVKGFIWVARLTSRTCAVCWAMHGSFHLTNEPFGTHPNCRCVMVPFMGGKNPVTLGATVFKNLPEEKQIAILGPGKHELYKQGVPIKYAVGYAQHPKWGPVRYERSIAEMASKVAIPKALGQDKLPAGTHAAAVAAAKAKIQAQAPAPIPVQAPPPAPTITLPEPPVPTPGKAAPPIPVPVPKPAPTPAKTYTVNKTATFRPAPVVPAAPAPPPAPKHPPDMDHAALRALDLLSDSTPWGSDHAGGFGGVVFDDDGRVMLRRNKGDHGGIRWTFAKVNSTAAGPVDQVLEAVRQKQGIEGQITGFVPGAHKGGVRYFMLRSKDGIEGPTDANTIERKWLTLEEAKKHILESTDEPGRNRDLGVLEAAFKERSAILSGKKDQWAPPPPPPPPPPPKPLPWEKPPVKAAKYKAPAKPAHFPDDPDGLQTVRTLGGSTGAKLVRDPKTGKQYVLKRGNSAEHVREEFHADQAYRALGIAVPEAHLYETKAGPVKLAEYIEGRTLDKLSGSERDAAFKELHSGFAADALLGNYDVVGMGLDNILVDNTGKAWRIDNGGSFRYRAQGALKTRWDEHVSTLWTMRGKTVLPDDQTQAAATSVFKDLGIFKIRRQIDAISEAKEKKLLEAIPDDLRDVVQFRLRTMRDVARHTKALEEDDWIEDYSDDVGKHLVGLRAANVTHTLPQYLRPKSYTGSPYQIYDEKGEKYDHFAVKNHNDKDALVAKLEKYMSDQGTTLSHVSGWQSAQAGNSWNDANAEHKVFLSQVVKLKKGETFWKGHKEASGKKLWAQRMASGQQQYREAQAIQKAAVLEVLSRVEIPNVDRSTGRIFVVRTEDKGILPHHGITPGIYQDGLTMKRGLSESYSLMQTITVHGSEATLQEVPITRVHGAYFMARDRHSSTAFLGEGENEIAILWRGSKDRLDYVSRSEAGKRLHKYKYGTHK